MGRIRIKLVKRTGQNLMKRNEDKFKADFEHNKKALTDLAEIHSKKLRNIIAGYITQLARRNQK